MAAVKRALFKTAYLQRVVMIDVDICPLCYVGDLMTYTAATKTLAVVATNVTAVPSDAVIIAQSDITLHNINANRSTPYGHVDVESKNLQADKSVAAKLTGGANKKVAVFFVTDPNDIVMIDGDAPTEQLRS